MRIKTSGLLRYIYKLRNSIDRRNTNFYGGLYWLASLSSVSKRAIALSLFFIAVLALRFAAYQFAELSLLGFSLLGLFLYRFANTFFRATSIRHFQGKK